MGVCILIFLILFIGGILMTIHIGSTKIGKINVGSSAIGKVYNGSSIVFQSGPSLKLYGMTFQMNNQTFDKSVLQTVR